MGLMQDKQLMISDFLAYAQEYHHDREFVSRDARGRVHRYTHGHAGRRARQLASALLASGVRAGDRVDTLAMNSHRHFELFYGVSRIGAVLHTVNPRLYVEQLLYILEHAVSRVLFVDPPFVGLAQGIVGRLPAVEQVVVLDGAPAGDWDACERFICAGDGDFDWPVFDEKTASSLC
jgi:3-(methylthio)propionyl---CoA ligase